MIITITTVIIFLCLVAMAAFYLSGENEPLGGLSVIIALAIIFGYGFFGNIVTQSDSSVKIEQPEIVYVSLGAFIAYKDKTELIKDFKQVEDLKNKKASVYLTTYYNSYGSKIYDSITIK